LHDIIFAAKERRVAVGRRLARPGGNMTGMFLDLPELSGKQVGLLKEGSRLLCGLAAGTRAPSGTAASIDFAKNATKSTKVVSSNDNLQWYRHQ
jgi:hypothetical protein